MITSFLFLISGATTLILQVAWTKELSYLLGNTLYAVSTVVAAFMCGLRLGAWLAARLAPRWKRPLQVYATMEFAIAVFGALSIPALRNMERVFGWIYGAVDPAAGIFLLIRFVLVFAAVAPAVTLMGMTLPVVTGTLGQARRKLRRIGGLAVRNEYRRRNAWNFCRRFFNRTEIWSSRILPDCGSAGRNRCRSCVAMGQPDGRSRRYPQEDR